LRHLLVLPEMAEFVAAAPEAGRIVRPLCRMLGQRPPEWLRLPRRPTVALQGPETPVAAEEPPGINPPSRPAGTSPGTSLPLTGQPEKTGPPRPRPGGLYWNGVGSRWA
jgi:hypothetical protein